MVKKLALIFVFLFLLAQFVSATDTKITIKTIPDYNLMISALKPGSVYSLVESFHVDSGASGEVSVTLSSNVNSFNLAVWVKKDNVKIVNKKFEDEFPAGIPLVLEVYPEWYEKEEKIEANETNSSLDLSENQTNQITEDTETDSELETDEINQNIGASSTSEEGIKNAEPSSITGSVIFGNAGILTKKIIYTIIMGAFILLLITLIISKKLKKISSQKDIKIKKLSEIKDEKKSKEIKPAENKPISPVDSSKNSREPVKSDRILEAEKKLKEAQDEINKLKKEERIMEIKKRIVENEKELIKLRGDNQDVKEN